MQHYISIYSNETEELFDEIKVHKSLLPELKDLIGDEILMGDEELIYSYPLNDNMIEFFKNKLEINFDFEKYEYFLECFQS